MSSLALGEVYAESFTRLYPAVLYPGGSQKDVDRCLSSKVAVLSDLDTLNPLSWLKVAKRIRCRGGVLVVPSWTFFTAPCLGWIARRVRRRGVEVVTIVHNVADHESSWWKAGLMRWQIGASDRIITHSDELAQAVRQTGFGGQIDVVAHPPYTDFPDPAGDLPREHALELLCFGLVRPYKGVDIAIEAMTLADLPDARLTIAGEIWPDANEVRDKAIRLSQVELVDSYVSDQKAAELFDRADVLLLPYRSVTGSGILAMARHYRVPVIASDLPSLARDIAEDGLGWTFAAGDAQALAQLLRRDVTRESAEAISASMPNAVTSSGWRDFAAKLLNVRAR
jgi:glycosyltransferase involved in cell wall biosynthesis